MTLPPGARWPLIALEASYTVNVAAVLAGVSRTTILEAIVASELPVTWGERGRRIRGADLLTWMDRDRDQPRGEERSPF